MFQVESSRFQYSYLLETAAKKNAYDNFLNGSKTSR